MIPSRHIKANVWSVEIKLKWPPFSGTKTFQTHIANNDVVLDPSSFVFQAVSIMQMAAICCRNTKDMDSHGGFIAANRLFICRVIVYDCRLFITLQTHSHLIIFIHIFFIFESLSDKFFDNVPSFFVYLISIWIYDIHSAARLLKNRPSRKVTADGFKTRVLSGDSCIVSPMMEHLASQ